MLTCDSKNVDFTKKQANRVLKQANKVFNIVALFSGTAHDKPLSAKTQPTISKL